MALFTLGKEHEVAFKEILNKSEAWNKHKAVQSSLYVLSSIPVVRANWEKVFNIQGCFMIPDSIDQLTLSTGERILFALAANLYNGTILAGISLVPESAFGWLDHQHKLLFMQALQYRFLFDEVPLSVRLAG